MDAPLMITVPKDALLEILRLSGEIEAPMAVFRKDDKLSMANEVVETSIAKAGQISNIIIKYIGEE